MHKAMIVVAASLALGIATIATVTLAFAHGGGGRGGHFGGGGRFAGGHFGEGFRGGFEGIYGFGGPYYGYGTGSCYVLTPSGYVWACY